MFGARQVNCKKIIGLKILTLLKLTESLPQPYQESLEATEVSMMHFKSAICQIDPSDLKFYIDLAAKFRRLVG